ncbi:E3 ubiquitin ligase [Abeliophyllum distichum]|uniref:E3 ubiquitin ligase n=1 Tax=Abeliophyllum distichum TaxID=126358 RepID=A0ABD1PCE1_9LAMI
MRHLSLPDESSGVTLQSKLNPEASTHQDSLLRKNPSEDVYHRFGQFVAKVESFLQDAHEESVRHKKAKNDVIDAIGRAKASATMSADLLRRKIEIEESLERSKEEVEEMNAS